MTSILIDRTDGLSSATAIKGPCRAATTANVALYGEQTVDSIALVTGDRVLVKSQTAGYENGIYVVDTGQWRRSKDFNRTNDVFKGTEVFVTDGTANGQKLWGVSSANPVDVGTDTITFVVTTASAAQGALAETALQPDDIGVSVQAHSAILDTLAAGSYSDIRNLLDTAPYVPTRTVLKALDTTKDTTAILTEAGREGIFIWKTGNYSALITADTAEGIYVKADAIASSAGAWVRAYVGAADMRWYGAIGDGTTNDTTAVAAAFAAGVVMSGAKKTYAVSGDVSLPAGLDLSDAYFKQLTPANTNRKTLYANGVSSVTLRRVKVDRNGAGTSGGLNTAAGIWIDGGSFHTIDDCEVFGSDAGSGMVFNGCSDFKVSRPYIHDILYVAASLPADDQCMAILFNGCSNFSLLEPRINHLGGIVGGSFRQAFGRMLCFGFGCSQFRVYGGEIQDGDVGIDLSGSKGNTFYSVIGVTVRNVETWGIKQSNYNRFGRIVACDVYRAGSAGYVLSGPTVNVDPDTPMPDSAPKNITIMGCGAWQTGVGNTGRGTSQPAGFLIIPGGASSYQDYPRGIRFVSCTAVDNQTVKTQYQGFRNEVSYGGVPLNEMVDCRSEGYSAGGQHSAGFHYPACRVYNSAAVAIPNNTTTAIGFDSEDYDGSAMHSTSVNNDAVFVPHPGWYHIDAEATIVANGTGSRFLGVTLGGVAVTRLRDQSPGLSSNDHTLKLSGDIYVSDVTGGIRLTILQNSGGSLNVNANASLSVRQVLFN